MSDIPSVSQPKDSAHALSRRAGTVGGLTLLSRIAGLIRDVVIAYYFGTKGSADAFYVAFRIPNLFRRLLAEGAFTMAFVPIYADYRRRSRAEAAQAANAIFTVFLGFLILLVTVGMIAAPWLVKAVAYGFTKDPEKFRLTVSLVRVMFPYLLLVSVMALMMGILNSWRHFLAPAAAPILFNVGMICGAVLFTQWFLEPTYGLAVGVLCGGLAQCLVQIPPLWRRRVVPRLTLALRHPSITQLVRIMIPAAFGGAVYQLNVMLITLLASFLPEGSVSYLWYADRISEFPLGIFAVAMATVTLPTLADQHSRNDVGAFKDTANFGLRIAFAEAIPSAMGLIILARPVVRLLFEGGAFSTTSTAGTSGALIFFALGIPFISGVRNIIPAFYACKDAKSPVKIAAVTLCVNGVLAVVLMQSFLHRGLALAMACASLVQFVLLLAMLRRKLGPLGISALVTSIVRSLGASCVMGVVVMCAVSWLELETTVGRAWLLSKVGACILIGMAVYLPLLRVLSPRECRHFTALLRRR